MGVSFYSLVGVPAVTGSDFRLLGGWRGPAVLRCTGVGHELPSTGNTVALPAFSPHPTGQAELPKLGRFVGLDTLLAITPTEWPAGFQGQSPQCAEKEHLQLFCSPRVTSSAGITYSASEAQFAPRRHHAQ